MKVKLKTPDRFIIAFNRREILILDNCLREACHGMLMDRFIPANDELAEMLECMDRIAQGTDLFRVKPAAI